MKLFSSADIERCWSTPWIVRLWIALELGAVLTVIIMMAACGAGQPESPVPEAATAMATEVSTAANQLTAAEEAAGWTLLFDGATFDGWRGLGRDAVPQEHWVIDDGAIHKVSSGNVPTAPDGQPLEGGDIMTVATFEDFELVLEWKVAPGANSGIKYNVSEEMSMSAPPRHAALGFEYQIIDDDSHPDAQLGPNRTSAAMYDLIGPSSEKQLRPVGEFNEARLVFRGRHGEHWLNGAKVVEFDLASDEFAALLAASKYASIEGFAQRRAGHIVLQDHGDDIWFRSIKIRELPPPETH